MGLFGSLLGPISEVAGNIFQGNRDYKHQREIMDTNMMFQERMSSTAFQRAVTDMQAAGLNPMLAYQQGGSSSPAGSTGGTPAPSRVGQAISSGVSSAMALKRNNAEVDLLRAQKEKVVKETPGAEAESERLRYVVDHILPQEWAIKYAEADIAMMAAEMAKFNVPFDKRIKEVEAHLAVKGMPERLRIQTLERLVLELERRARDLGMPQLEAEARAWRTGYGQNVRPYLGDAAKAVGAASGAVGGYFLGKGVSAYRAAREGAARLGGGYSGPKGNGPAVFRPRSTRKETQSGYQMKRPLPGPQDR